MRILNDSSLNAKFTMLCLPLVISTIAFALLYINELNKNELSAFWPIAGLLSVLAYLFGWGFLGVYKNLFYRLSSTANRLEKAVEENSLDISFTESSDEIGRIAKMLNLLLKQNAEHIQEMQAFGLEIKERATRSSAAASDCAIVLDSQHGDTTQLSSAVTEMTTTAQEIANRTHEAADSAQQTQALTRDGASTVEHSTKAVSVLADDVHELGTIITNLSERSTEVATALDVIKSVAEQTNLLALNAAIEAARAGDQGRGFAVVADEVRTLASRTQTSAEEITEIVSTVSQESQNANNVVTECLERANSTVNQVQGLSSILESIDTAAQTISEMTTQIATASNQQVSTNEEIAQSVVRVDEMTKECVEQVSKLAEAAQENRTVAEKMSGSAVA